MCCLGGGSLCLQQETGKTTDSDFWAWHSSALGCFQDVVAGELVMPQPDLWRYQWGPQLPDTNMSYELLTPQASCKWDLGGGPQGGPNGTVGADDLARLLGNWGPYDICDVTVGQDVFKPMDFQPDGNVDASDLAQLLGNWGPCPCVQNADCPSNTCLPDSDGDGFDECAPL